MTNPEIMNENPSFQYSQFNQNNIEPENTTKKIDNIKNKFLYQDPDENNLSSFEPSFSQLEEKIENFNEKNETTEISGKKRYRNEEVNKNSTKNQNQFNFNKIHISKKEEKPKFDLLGEESERKEIYFCNTNGFENKYKHLIFDKLIELALKKDISYLKEIMDKPLKEILNLKDQETCSFSELTLLRYFNLVIEKIQNKKTENNENKKTFKIKKFNAKEKIKFIRNLYDINKQNDSKKEKEKEENKETKIEPILNNRFKNEIEDDYDLINYSLIFENNFQLYPQQMDYQGNTDCESKGKTNQEFNDKNINAKIKNRTLDFMINDFNDNISQKMFITKGKKEKGEIKKINLHIVN